MQKAQFCTQNAGGRNRFSLGEGRDPQQFTFSLRADSTKFYLNIGTHKHKMGEGKRKEVPNVSKAEICKPLSLDSVGLRHLNTSMYPNLGHVSTGN